MSLKDMFEVEGVVKLFPQTGGWYYISVPGEFSKLFKDVSDRGLVPIEVTLGSSKWNTSLLPMGDGTHFIALKASVRKTEAISKGDKIKLSFKVTA